MTQESNSGILPASLTLPHLASRRGPKTLRGKLRASQNAAKYFFSRSRTKRDQDAPLLDKICAMLGGRQNEAFDALDLNAIALELLKGYRIRCEIEETTRQCVAACRVSSDANPAPYLKHLEGLDRYDRRSRSRLKTLLRPDMCREKLRLSNTKRSILADNRKSS